MADGGKQQQKKTHKHTEDAPEVKEGAEVAEKAEEIKDDLDDLLDEIDEVLEQNAEEFVRSYVQKGGQ
ncbi:MAG TPA: ubiquitin-like protein Pup [Actinomycetota bacterium]